MCLNCMRITVGSNDLMALRFYCNLKLHGVFGYKWTRVNSQLKWRPIKIGNQVNVNFDRVSTETQTLDGYWISTAVSHILLH